MSIEKLTLVCRSHLNFINKDQIKKIIFNNIRTILIDKSVEKTMLAFNLLFGEKKGGMKRKIPPPPQLKME